jgi:hypothetical protein
MERITSFGCVIDTRPASNQPAGELCLGTPQLDDGKIEPNELANHAQEKIIAPRLHRSTSPKPIPCVLRENSPRCRLAALSRIIRVTKM